MIGPRAGTFGGVTGPATLAGGRAGEDGRPMSEKQWCSGGGSPLYGLGVLGAWVYFWEQADGFWWHVLAVGEGLIWPAFAVYHGLGAL